VIKNQEHVKEVSPSSPGKTTSLWIIAIISLLVTAMIWWTYTRRIEQINHQIEIHQTSN